MAIQYPVPEGSRWSTFSISKNDFVARNRPWPNTDGSPIEGLSEDLVMLRHVTTAVPPVDQRLFFLVSTPVVDLEANELRTEWVIHERDVTEKVESLYNVESEKAASMMDIQREVIETRLAVSALIEQLVNAQMIGGAVKTRLQGYAKKGRRIWANRQRLQQLVADVKQGITPDIDAGWEEGSDEDEV